MSNHNGHFNPFWPSQNSQHPQYRRKGNGPVIGPPTARRPLIAQRDFPQHPVRVGHATPEVEIKPVEHPALVPAFPQKLPWEQEGYLDQMEGGLTVKTVSANQVANVLTIFPEKPYNYVCISGMCPTGTLWLSCFFGVAGVKQDSTNNPSINTDTHSPGYWAPNFVVELTGGAVGQYRGNKDFRFPRTLLPFTVVPRFDANPGSAQVVMVSVAYGLRL